MRKLLTICLWLRVFAVGGDAIASAETDSVGIDRLIGQLGSADFKEREAARRRLEEIGEAALPALRIDVVILPPR